MEGSPANRELMLDKFLQALSGWFRFADDSRVGFSSVAVAGPVGFR
jgi:hypothetical protein